MTILLVEQNARLALEVARRGYVMESGAITLAGEATTLLPTRACARPTSAKSRRDGLTGGEVRLGGEAVGEELVLRQPALRDEVALRAESTMIGTPQA